MRTVANMNHSQAVMRMRQYKILNGSWLKIIAMISMVIDHLGCFIFGEMDVTLFSFHGYSLTLAYAARCIGRIAFPIYAFLIVEGFKYTHDRKKYALNMAVFAVISEIPYNLVYSGTLRYSVQNVYFTLLLGFLMLCTIEQFKEQKLKQALMLVVLFFVSIVINSSHTYTGVILIVVMYLLDKHRAPQAIIGTALQPRFMYCSLLAYIPLNMYNGERGFIRGKAAKYFFYLFYPAHLLILYFMKRQMFGY